jgi:acetyl-CoA acyltransferase
MSSTLEMPDFSPNPKLVETNPAVYRGMGLTAEQVAREVEVSREDQDEFALRSHTVARKAVERRIFDEEIVPFDVEFDWVDKSGEIRHAETTFKRNEGSRDTSMEKLAKLPTVFQEGGTVTAGNSSRRSHGAAVVVMEREEAEGRGLRPLARFVGFAVGGVSPEVMGIGQ